MLSALLTRSQFREAVFARDNYLCVLCKFPAVDAHHILERRLWSDGGYYIDNGASLCESHHIQAESTEIGCEVLRGACKIRTPCLPPHLYLDQNYDKWGNPILDNGQRMSGELFHDESVQKVLQPFLHLFTQRVKYPRTYHLPWSPTPSNDDRIISSLERLQDEEIVVTVKMDGENTTLYSDYIHARSLDYTVHESRNRVRALWSEVGYNIPEGWRVCGENLCVAHSIHYKRLPDYFLMFSIWNDRNVCLSWADTIEWAELIGVQPVPVLYRGPWDEKILRKLYTPLLNEDECEGYVVRVAREFHYKEFRHVVGKYVRAGHVPQHGGRRAVLLNKLV